MYIKYIEVQTMTFRELLVYIIENDITGTFTGNDGCSFLVDKYGRFGFEEFYEYGAGETYEIERMVEPDAMMTFEKLLTINQKGEVQTYAGAKIPEVLYDATATVQALIEDEFKVVWKRGG